MLTDGYKPNTILTFFLKKKIPLEEFEYFFEEVFQNKISRVKRQNHQNIDLRSIGLFHHPTDSIITKMLSLEELSLNNVIRSSEISSVEFSSIEKILKKADNIYIIVEDWNEQKSDKFKAYSVNLLEMQGGL